MPLPLQSNSPVRQSAKAALWKKRLADFEQSNLSAAQFCQSIGCSEPSFYHWKRKLDPSATRSSFLQVQTGQQASVSIELKLPNGVSIFIPVDAIHSLSHILQQVA